MARSVIAGGSGFVIDTTELKTLARDIRRGKGPAAVEFKRELREAGLLVAEEAKSRAPSQKIAGTIKVRTRGATVEVVAGSQDVPEAALLELGNKRRGRVQRAKEGGTFRHPVFQTETNPDTWVSQEMHPFLTPALEAKAQEAAHMVSKTVDNWLRRAGFQDV